MIRPGRAALDRSADQHPDRGSASIWVLSGAVLVLLLAAVVTLRTAAVLARHRAESAADLAALAAATRIGISANQCSAAAVIALANGAELSSCQVILAADGRSGTVQVEVRLRVHLSAGLGSHIVTAQARAARLSSS